MGARERGGGGGRRRRKRGGGRGRESSRVIPSTLPEGVRISSVDAGMFADLRMMLGVCVFVEIRSQIAKFAQTL